MSTSIPLRPTVYLFTLTLATSGLISILSLSPGVATRPPISSSPLTNYVPPARETPLRTESAGVRLSEEKGPATVTQNTIATERLTLYHPAIAPILDWLQSLILRTQQQSQNSTHKQTR
jgi:hypothetical protein